MRVPELAIVAACCVGTWACSGGVGSVTEEVTANAPDAARDAAGDGDTAAPPEDTPDAPETVVAAPLAHATIGPDGGVLDVGAFRVVVPAGALASPLELGVYASDLSPTGAALESAVYELRPAGTTFAVAVVASFVAPGDGTPSAVVWSRPESPTDYQQLPSFLRDGRVEAGARHFSTVYLANSTQPGTMVACCTPKDPQLHTDLDCLYAPNACDTTICDLSAGPCPPSPNDCCSAIDPNNDLQPDGCGAIMVTADCTGPAIAPLCQWNASCPTTTQPPLNCCTVDDPGNPPPGLPNGCVGLPYDKCGEYAAYCHWNVSDSCPVPPPCCGPKEAGHDLPGAGCAGFDAYFECQTEPNICQWNASDACLVPPPPTSCCYALDPNNDAQPFPCAVLPDKVECEQSAGVGHCKWNDTAQYCSGGGTNTACCKPLNPVADYQPGGCWSFATSTDCLTTGANACHWSTAPQCPQPPPPPPCCMPTTAGQDDPNLACALRVTTSDCAGSPLCTWNTGTSCPPPPVPDPPCCAAIDPNHDASGTPCADRLTNADCRASLACMWNVGPTCPVPTPLTCCSPKDAAHDLPGGGCANATYAECLSPQGALYCQWNAGSTCVAPTSCCTPIDPQNDLQPWGCASFAGNYAECELSAGSGVCNWNAGPTCPVCAAPQCRDNLSTTGAGTCAGYGSAGTCNAHFPTCAWGCGFVPDVCCPVAPGSVGTCAVLGQAACEGNGACAFSSVGVCP